MPAPPGGPARPASHLVLLYAVLRGGVAGLVAAAALEAVYIFVGANIHVVAPGFVYRSARLDSADLERVVRQYKIRTVVNLCGCCDPLPPYLEECQAASRLDVCQEDVGFSACRLPPVTALRRLVEVLDHCDYPILIHCHRGIDRTGMASAVALLLHTDMGLSEAREQLGPRYGHLPYGKTGQIDLFFDLYQEWLAANGKAHSPAVLRGWIEKDYCPGECRGGIELLEPREGPLRAAPGAPIGFRVRCTNKSIKPWVMQPGANAGVHLGWLLCDENGGGICEGRSGLFDNVVPPGESIDLMAALPPQAPGRYRVQIDMVDEQHAWFYQTGATEPVVLELEVR